MSTPTSPDNQGRPVRHKVDPLAIAQLKAWEILARQAPLTVAIRRRQLHLICVADRMTVFVLADGEKRGYHFSLDLLMAALVAHLRQLHRELDPDKGE